MSVSLLVMLKKVVGLDLPSSETMGKFDRNDLPVPVAKL